MRSALRWGGGLLGLAVALPVTFATGIAITWAGFGVSGCPHPLAFDDTVSTCRSGWESEASWVIGAFGTAVAFGGPLAILGCVLRRGARRSVPGTATHRLALAALGAFVGLVLLGGGAALLWHYGIYAPAGEIGGDTREGGVWLTAGALLGAALGGAVGLRASRLDPGVTPD